jgi:hypothetical protein
MGMALIIPQPTNPAQLPSLPAWLQPRSDALAAADKAHYQPRQQLPAAMILNSSEQAEVRRHIDQLLVFLDLGRPTVIRGKTLENPAALGAVIAELLLKSGQKLDQAASDVLTDDYFDALEDLPAWTVREGLRRWNRGQSVQVDPKQPHDFRWAPKPPILRKLAEHELARVQHRIRHLQRLCDAKPVVEYSDEHRKSMLGRIADLFREKPVQLMTEAAE